MKEIKWLGQASVKIVLDNDMIIYIDPYNVSENDSADYIFITHTHYDHFSENDISSLLKEGTKIFATVDCKSSDFLITNYMSPTESYGDGNINVKAIPAYNINKPFHPKSNNWNGYIIECDGIKIYHAGDTDIISEMKEAEGVDIALVPVDGTYTMTATEAVKAINEIIKPKKAIPIHWGSLVGSKADAQNFVDNVNCDAEIL